MDKCWILVIKEEFWSQLHMTGYIFKARRLSSSARFVSWILYLCLTHSHVGPVRAQGRQKHPPGIKHTFHRVSTATELHGNSFAEELPPCRALHQTIIRSPPPSLPGQALRTGQQKQRVWITLESMLSQLHQFVLYKDRPSILSSSMMLLISIYILITGSLWEHDSCNEKSGMKCHAM